MVNNLLTWAGQIIMRRLLVSLEDYPECFSVLKKSWLPFTARHQGNEL